MVPLNIRKAGEGGPSRSTTQKTNPKKAEAPKWNMAFKEGFKGSLSETGIFDRKYVQIRVKT